MSFLYNRPDLRMLVALFCMLAMLPPVSSPPRPDPLWCVRDPASHRWLGSGGSPSLGVQWRGQPGSGCHSNPPHQSTVRCGVVSSQRAGSSVCGGRTGTAGTRQSATGTGGHGVDVWTGRQVTGGGGGGHGVDVWTGRQVIGGGWEAGLQFLEEIHIFYTSCPLE